MKTLSVKTSNNSYDIKISKDGAAHFIEEIKSSLSADKIIVVTDENVLSHHSDLLKDCKKNSELIVLPPGESTKSYNHYQFLCESVLALGVTRKSCLVAFGGGVIGDLVGFVAGTLLRGIRFVQVPTTLLAQVDSSVGGKTAINSTHGKNLIGVFHPPSLVLSDVSLLKTLPKEHFIDGCAEVIKYALIDDAQFLKWLESSLSSILSLEHDVLIEIVHQCCVKKAKYVQADEYEKNIRALLNFGHTFGHAIEILSDYKTPHGSAVSMGMVMAARYSCYLGLLSHDDCNRVEKLLTKFGLPTHCPYAISEMLPYLLKDKKAERDSITLILLKDLGKAFIQTGVRSENLLAGFT